MALPAPQAQRLRAPGRLPTVLTSFVGRTVEVDKVAGLLERHRMVTVTGPGGSGKTRLATEVGRRVGGRFADGVAWVDLSAVDQHDHVAGTIAAAAGIQQRPSQSMQDSLVAGLSARQLLVILDNCEQVADAVADTCELLLADCDDLWVLATSTVTLRVRGEARFRVPALPLPEPGGSLAQIAGSDAVALFVDRVADTDPDFELTESSQDAIAEIVRRLDGMPLAVELAAARASALGITELRLGLDDRFTLLVGNNRGAPARQRSLQAAVDWSYQLLPAVDQQLYRRLAVFAAPFTLAAAAEVCGPQAREVIPRLVDCSLLGPPVEDADGRSRYRMLETMRAHADSLLAGEERTAAFDALARWALAQDLGVQAPLNFTDHDNAILAWIDAERDNLRKAIAWATGRASPAGLVLETVLSPWYVWRGRYAEGIAALQSALAACPEPTAEVLSAAEFWLGYLALLMGRYDESIAYLSEAEGHAVAGGQSPWLVNSLAVGVFPRLVVGRADEAAGNAVRASQIARDTQYREGLAFALHAQASVAYQNGFHEAALALAEQEQQAAGHPYELAFVDRADNHLELRQYSQAEEAALAGLGIAQTRENRAHEAWFLIALAAIYAGSGRDQEAGKCVSDGLPLARAFSEPGIVGWGLMTAAELGLRMGRLEDGAALLAARNAIAEEHGLPSLASEDADNRRLREAFQAALEPDKVQAARDRGTAMSVAAAIELAGSVANPIPLPEPASDGSRTTSGLSHRERELVALVAGGFTDAQVAEQLFISIRTVRSHLDRIRDKTGCRRRADLTRLALADQLR